MVRINGPDIPYGTQYYRDGTVRFESSVGLLEAHEVEGDEAVTLEYIDPSETDSTDDSTATPQRKLGGGTLYHAMTSYGNNHDLV